MALDLKKLPGILQYGIDLVTGEREVVVSGDTVSTRPAAGPAAQAVRSVPMWGWLAAGLAVVVVLVLLLRR